MSTFATYLYRDVTCGAAATIITLILSFTFVECTSLPPGATHARAAVFVAIQPYHAWFGQPEPAVLVD
jgi:hypothetical protein